jgi:hypothetical protein
MAHLSREAEKFHYKAVLASNGPAHSIVKAAAN